MPVAFAVMLAAFCAGGAPLYVSSAASAATRQQLDETCRSRAALVLPIPFGMPEDFVQPTAPGIDFPDPPMTEIPGSRETILDIGAGVPFMDTPRSGAHATPTLASPNGDSRRVTLIHLEGLTEHVTPRIDSLAPGEVALSRRNAEQLHVSVGDVLQTEDQRTLTVAYLFDDIPFAPVPDAWCGLADYVQPTPAGDLPPASALAAPETVAQFTERSTSYIEYRVTTDPVTLTDMHATEAAYAAADEAYRQAFDGVRLEGGRSELPNVLNRAEGVEATVQRSLAPVRLTSLLSIAGVLVATSVLMARERRRELRLMALRGTRPTRIAVSVLPRVVAVVAPAAVIGTLLSWLAVRAGGPSTLLESGAMGRSALATVVTIVVAPIIVAGTVAAVADGFVDRVHHRSPVRWVVPLIAAGLIALTWWSFRRIDELGGIRTSGVQARGGDLLALGFPLFALLAATVTVCLVLLRVVPLMRLTGARLSRAVRLGWRRVVLEAGPTVATVAAVSLAAGSFITATALSDGAQRQLSDKAEVYVGSDVALAIFGDPTVDPVVDAPHTIVWTTVGKWDGGRVTMWGLDRSTFADVARMRDDASDSSLADLVALAAPAGDDGIAPAVAVGLDAEVGDIVPITVVGTDVPVQVRVVEVVRFFPGQASGSAYVAVDESVMEQQVPYSVRKLLVRDPPPDLADVVAAQGLRTGVLLDAETTFQASNFSGLRWSYRPLAALGLLFAVVAAVVQLLVVAARRDTRRAAHVVMRRTGVTTRSLWTAALVESSVPLLVGLVVGVAAAAGASALTVVRIDPMPTLAPPTNFVMPWDTVLTMLVVVPLWAVATALVIVRTTVRADPMRAMRGDQ